MGSAAYAKVGYGYRLGDDGWDVKGAGEFGELPEFCSPRTWR